MLNVFFGRGGDEDGQNPNLLWTKPAPFAKFQFVGSGWIRFHPPAPRHSKIILPVPGPRPVPGRSGNDRARTMEFSRTHLAFASATVPSIGIVTISPPAGWISSAIFRSKLESKLQLVPIPIPFAITVPSVPLKLYLPKLFFGKGKVKFRMLYQALTKVDPRLGKVLVKSDAALSQGLKSR